ncbi:MULTISPECIES: response regulator transcription factor [unclassified Beijerinckia]|uniref:response regulator n=1 Tax=unclassified Beijerinckia TaxID=2638183 RepID=UPI00089A2B76|nr:MULTISPECIES: response regulator transcription factor [unclassified Beijerinckia]MDH7796132.1 DNA-binding NarL/FixJ family response regulator [Beijerinckia sp. GAS462]SEC31712.1 two component transcriptional regulator, LuxR family [Beijerinckia sp. 28-YEA-48]
MDAQPSRIRVMLAEDQTLLRRTFAKLLSLEADIEIAAEAADGEEAIQMARAHRPDVILMDLQMPRLDGIAATRRIVADLPSTHVIVLTTFEDDEQIFNAINAGAIGYLLKDSREAEIIEAIRIAASGASALSPRIAHKLLAAFKNMGTPDPEQPVATGGNDLTEREAGILSLLVAGKSNREIADELALAEGTIKNYVSRILSKHDARSRTELVARSLRRPVR